MVVPALAVALSDTLSASYIEIEPFEHASRSIWSAETTSSVTIVCTIVRCDMACNGQSIQNVGIPCRENRYQ
jgi:hypothetical protein